MSNSSDPKLNELICRKMREIRKKRGKKQLEVAEMIGVTPQHYQQCESGKSPPNLRILEKLCEAYNIHISYFFTDDDLSVIQKDGSIFLDELSPDDVILLRSTGDLSPEAKKNILEFVRYLKFKYGNNNTENEENEKNT